MPNSLGYLYLEITQAVNSDIASDQCMGKVVLQSAWQPWDFTL